MPVDSGLQSTLNQAVVEFLTNVNDILIEIRQCLLAFYGEDTVDVKYCVLLSEKIEQRWWKCGREQPSLLPL